MSMTCPRGYQKAKNRTYIPSVVDSAVLCQLGLGSFYLIGSVSAATEEKGFVVSGGGRGGGGICREWHGGGEGGGGVLLLESSVPVGGRMKIGGNVAKTIPVDMLPGIALGKIIERRPSTPPIYSPGPSTPPSYSPGPSRNAECSNCKLLLGKIKLRKKEIMSWLRRCAELREAAQSDEWVEMLVLYCWRSAEEDFRVAGVKLCEEVAAANEETSYFIQELDVVPGLVVVTQKTSEFLKETQEKDDERLRQLEALARDTEARAREKCIFIEKLKGNQPF
ncbi:hypothetical protein Tco_1345741 [Tanacetum coccineum]